MGTSDIALERVQALLKVDTGSGSLHEHLVRLSRKLAEQKPGEALAQLETLSRHLKKSNFRGTPAPDVSIPIVADSEAEDARLQWCGDVLKLVRQPSDPTAAPKVLGAVQNFLEDAAMFRWAGVGFSQQESYHLGAALRKLASDTPSIESLRLWGKVLGTDGDYVVAEGVLKSIPKPAVGDAPEKPPLLPDSPEYDVEPRGEGANTFTYWVSAGGCAPWVRLPAARASNVVASRKIKRIMSGNLDAPVLSMPWFPGKERHFLRAQIARISATCSLATTGWYEADDEAGPGKIKEAENPTESFPAPDAVAAADGWVHRMPCLNRIGRCSFPDVDALMEAGYEKFAKEIGSQIEAEGDPKELLGGIANDLGEIAKPEGQEEEVQAWSFKVFGDKGVYQDSKTHQVAAVRSMIWPGATTVTQGTKFANLYVGYGMKCGTLMPPNKETGFPLLAGTDSFSPLIPDDIMGEPEDLEEQDEPNPGEDDVESDGEEVDPADAE
jgi:radial spoke head protein 4A